MTDDDLDLVPIEQLLDALARRYEHVMFLGVGEDGQYRRFVNTTDYFAALGGASLLHSDIMLLLRSRQRESAEGV